MIIVSCPSFRPLFHGAQQAYYRQENQWWVTAADPGAELELIRHLYAIGLIFNPALESSAQSLAEHIPYWLLPNSVKKAHETDWSEFSPPPCPYCVRLDFG